MSLEVFVNTLSAHWQFNSQEAMELALEALIDCFYLIEPGLTAGTISLTYDDSIERRALLQGSVSIKACIADARRVLRTRWYLYTRNRARVATFDLSRFSLNGGGEEIQGEASVEILEGGILAGFGGSPACDADEVELVNMDSGITARSPAVHEPTRLARLLPRYEANPKHRPETYMREGGERVAPMTVGDVDAQRALLGALNDGAGHLFGVFGRILLKFVLTRNEGGGPVYHAYEVEILEVPEHILIELRNR